MIKTWFEGVIIAAVLAIVVLIVRQNANPQNANSERMYQAGDLIGGSDWAQTDNHESAPMFRINVPPVYRDWRLISVTDEAGKLKDIAVRAYRKGNLPLADSATISEASSDFVSSDENNRIFSWTRRRAFQQSFVAQPRTNGARVMAKDSIKYGTTGVRGYAQFNDGKPTDEAMLEGCFPCHAVNEYRDFVFNRSPP